MPIDWPSTGPDDPLHRKEHERALKRVRRICVDSPGSAEKISRGHMPVFTARGKNFAMVARTNARPSIWLAAQAGAQDVMIEGDPKRYYRPPYVGHRGWIGVWLDVEVDWPMLASLIREAHSVTATPSGMRTRSAPQMKR